MSLETSLVSHQTSLKPVCAAFQWCFFHNSSCIVVKMTRKDSIDFIWLSSLSFVTQEAIRSAWLVASGHERKWDRWDSLKGSYDRSCSVTQQGTCLKSKMSAKRCWEFQIALFIGDVILGNWLKWVNQVSGIKLMYPAMDDGKRNGTIESLMKLAAIFKASTGKSRLFLLPQHRCSVQSGNLLEWLRRA